MYIYLEAKEMHGEKARWELHKNDMRHLEQILEAKPHKTTVAGHLTPILQEPTYKRRSLMDFYILTCLCQLIYIRRPET